jgi:cyclase
MAKIRIIPRLDIKGPNVVKGIHLEGLRVVGDPRELAIKYYEDGADEILYVDTVASLYGRNNAEDIVKNACEEIFIPLSVGGGIKSLDDVRRLLRSGADKVAINTHGIKNPTLIKEIAEIVGSANLIVSIQAKKRDSNLWEAYIENGRERSFIDVVEWSIKAEQLGAGEILLTSVDAEGTQKGFDLELIKKISSVINIPLIVCGGAGNIDDIEKCINAGADGICIASILHYNKFSISEIKKELKYRGYDVRI